MSPDEGRTTLRDWVKLWVGTAIVALFGGIVWRFIRPFYHAYRIDSWLRSEPHYIVDYSKKIRPTGYFEFEVHLTEKDEPELVIENVHFQAPIRIEAKRELNPGLHSSIANEDMAVYRRRLKTEIESVLTNAPGIFNYQDFEGENCAFEDAVSISLEYRIYPDGLSQHELINGVVGIANALRYVRQREEQIKEEIEEQR